MKYTTVDTILSMVHRDLRGTNIHELDVIEWIGEAMGFLEVGELLEESVAFLEVKNHEAPLPDWFKFVIQIAKYDKEEIEKDCYKPGEDEDIDTPIEERSPDSCGDNFLLDWMLGEINEYRPYFDMQWQFNPWTVSTYYKRNFTPVRLANHTLFNSIVCRTSPLGQDLYTPDCEDEYTIVGTTDRKLRFSFEEGYVALSYLKTPVDKETGYPFVPDQVQHLSAVANYIKWKLSERLLWEGREGSKTLVEYYMVLWQKYIKQAKNWSKMPKTIDELQNLSEEWNSLIPRRDRYYSYFGKLGRRENRKFNDPNGRNKY